jgi:hypothetical protein
VYCGISCYGITSAVLVAGTSKQQARYTTMVGKIARNITKAEYANVLKKHLLPESACMFSAKGSANACCNRTTTHATGMPTPWCSSWQLSCQTGHS